MFVWSAATFAVNGGHGLHGKHGSFFVARRLMRICGVRVIRGNFDCRRGRPVSAAQVVSTTLPMLARLWM